MTSLLNKKRYCGPTASLVAVVILLATTAGTLTGCGKSTEATTKSVEQDQGTTLSSTANTLPIAIPPELGRFTSLAERLQAQGVAVAELRKLPLSDDYGAGVEVVIRSDSDAPRYTPEDVLGAALVFRAAVLARMAGAEIDAVGIAYLKPSGEVVGESVEAVDRVIAPEWYAKAQLTLDETTKLATAGIADGLAAGPFQVTHVEVALESDGTRALKVNLIVAGIAVANEHVNDPGDVVGGVVHLLNSTHQAKIGVMRIEIDTAAGEPVLWVLGDLQLERGTAWRAEGITNTYGPTPATTEGASRE